MTRSGRRALLLVLVAPAATAGMLQCHSYGDATNAPADGSTASDEATTTTTPDTDTSGCNHVLPPAGGQDDAPGVTVPPFWMSLDTLTFPLVTNDAGAHPGFDLDDTCTCLSTDHDGAAPCATPGVKPIQCDFDGGVDDGLSQAASNSLGAFFSANQGGAADGVIAQGGPTELVYVTGYNGTANDPQVGVAVVRAAGLLDNTSCDGGTRAGKPTQLLFPDGGSSNIAVYSPSHDGCDRYSAEPGQVIGTYPTRAPLLNVGGYVADHTLVVQLSQLDLALAGVNRVTLDQAYFVAKISPSGTSYRLDNGILAGRVPFANVVSFIGNFPVGSPGVSGQVPFCQSPYWAVTGQTLCSARDTMASPTDEFRGNVCDSVTIGAGFTATPTQVDDKELALTSPDQCEGQAITCQ